MSELGLDQSDEPMKKPVLHGRDSSKYPNKMIKVKNPRHQDEEDEKQDKNLQNEDVLNEAMLTE